VTTSSSNLDLFYKLFYYPNVDVGGGSFVILVVETGINFPS